MVMKYLCILCMQYQTQLMRKSGGFVTMSALYEVLRYGIKYHEPVSDLTVHTVAIESCELEVC